MFTVTAELVSNVFSNLVARIPAHDRDIALRYAMRLVGTAHTFPTASEAVGFISSEIWNSGYVR
jgi:hypothetical protein